MAEDRRLLYLWAQQVLGIGTRRAHAALEFFVSAEELFEADAHTLRMSGIFTAREVETVLAHDLTVAYKYLETTEAMGLSLLTYGDEAYPEALRAIHSPPLCLYVAGDAAHLSAPLSIAMVGTRHPNPYGLGAARLFAGGLASAGACVVSGLAIGIDAACHEAALGAGAPSVAVMGCGLDVAYPKPNLALRDRLEKRGCVVSEYPPGTPALPPYFPVRNRIISGLSMGCVVVQGKVASGSLITAGLALGQGRDVFAVVGPVDDPLMAGCHELVRQGAKPVFGILDILSEYPAYGGEIPAISGGGTLSAAGAKPSPLPDFLTEEQVQIVTLLRQSPQSVEAMAQFTGIMAGRLLATLTELEIFGLVVPQPGRVFRAL